MKDFSALKSAVTHNRTLVYVVTLYVIGLSILCLLVWSIGDRDFWYDEAYTYCFVASPWSDFLTVIQHLDIGVALYYTVLRAWSAFFGTSEESLRLFSTTFAALSVFALYRLSIELFSQRVAIVAAGLLLCNSFWFQQAQTARVYSLAGFLSILASIAFLRLVRKRSSAIWTAMYIIIMTTLAASQLAMGLGVLVAHALSFYGTEGRRIPVSRALLTFTALLIIYSIALYLVTTVGATLLHTPIHITIKSVWAQISSLAGRKFALIALSILAITGIFRSGPAYRSNAIMLAIWTLAPILLIVTLSLFNSAALGSRYMFSALFPFLILASFGLSRLQPRPLVALGLATVLVAEGIGLYQFVKEPWDTYDRQVTKLTTHTRQGDAIIFVPPFVAVRVFTTMHYDKLTLPNDVETIPPHLDSAWQFVDQRMAEPDWTHLPTLAKRRLWLVTIARGDSSSSACDNFKKELSRLRPATVTIICLGRE